MPLFTIHRFTPAGGAHSRATLYTAERRTAAGARQQFINAIINSARDQKLSPSAALDYARAWRSADGAALIDIGRERITLTIR